MSRFMCGRRRRSVRVPSTRFYASIGDDPRHRGGTIKNPLRIVSIFLVGVVSTVIGVAVAAQPPQPPLRRPVTIVNHGSGLCLEMNGSGLGEPIQQQPCVDGRTTQRWVLNPHFVKNGATYSLINAAMCLDVRDGVDANRTVVQQWGCRNVPSMRWRFSPLIHDYFKVISWIGDDKGDKCLDVAGGSLEPGARIQIYNCTGGTANTAQIWKIQ